MNGTCDIKRCRQPTELFFYGKEVCEKHWSRECDRNDSFNLKKEFGVTE